MGQREKAAQAAELLKLEPGFTAEAWVDSDFYQPGSSSAALLIDGARKAGLPIGAAPPQLAARLAVRRLTASGAERAKAVAPRT